jgi:hypothetical protein
MSDERNADSVLFKLDTLKATAQAQAKANAEQGASRQLARLAAATPQSEGSGLIDVNTLASSTEDVSASSSLTSSAALSQSSLLSTSSVIESVAPPTAKPQSRLPLIILSVLTLVALAAAVAAIVLRG